MPRKKRCQISGIPHLVFQQGHNGERIFTSHADCRAYLSALGDSAASSGCRVHAYALAGGRIYILCTPFVGYGISRMMQGVAAKFAHYFNHAYRRTGSIWNGRYRSCLVEPDRYLLACYVFVEARTADPGVPGKVRSSYPCHGLGRGDPIVKDHTVYRRLAGSETARQAAYRGLAERGLDGGVEAEIEHALHHNLVLGCEAFKDEMEALGYGRARLGRPGRPRKSAAHALEHRPAAGSALPLASAPSAPGG